MPAERGPSGTGHDTARPMLPFEVWVKAPTDEVPWMWVGTRDEDHARAEVASVHPDWQVELRESPPPDPPVDEAVDAALLAVGERDKAERYEELLDAERRALDYQEFIAWTLDEFGARMPEKWKAHARAKLADEGESETCERGCCEWKEDGEVIRYASHARCGHAWDTETDEFATYTPDPKLDGPLVIHECLDCHAIQVTRTVGGKAKTVVYVIEAGERGRRQIAQLTEALERLKLDVAAVLADEEDAGA